MIISCGPDGQTLDTRLLSTEQRVDMIAATYCRHAVFRNCLSFVVIYAATIFSVSSGVRTFLNFSKSVVNFILCMKSNIWMLLVAATVAIWAQL